MSRRAIPYLNLGLPLGDRLLRRWVIAGPLILAAYIVLQCPCGRLPACHKYGYFGLVTVSVILVMLELLRST
jgi:hypothetical protein